MKTSFRSATTSFESCQTSCSRCFLKNTYTPTVYTLNQLIDSFSYQVDVDNKIILLLDDSALSSNLPNLETGNYRSWFWVESHYDNFEEKVVGTHFKENCEDKEGNLDRCDKRPSQGELRVSSCCSVLVKGNYHFIFGLTLKGIVPQFVFYRSVFVQKSTVKTH